MKFLKNPMSNALYIAFISAIYSMIFIVSSQFTPQYDKFLSNSSWAMFIRNGSMKYIGLGMLAIVIMIDFVSACKRKKLDEYQTIILEKILIFNGIVTSVFIPLSLITLVIIPSYFVEIIFAFIILQWILIN